MGSPNRSLNHLIFDIETGEEIIVEIGGLYEKTERTKEVQDKLAAAVGKVIKETYPEAKVKVFVSTFNPTTSGLWQSE